MKFAKDLYRWDLAQFFTPTTVTDFIVNIMNPQFGDHVCDPACGSADFLVAAFHIGREFNHGYADCVWGVDNSANAVQISVLNMVLNGDGKTNIRKDDSLENVNSDKERYDIMLCNPPFGTKIVETRANVLRQFDLGYEWNLSEEGEWAKSDSLLTSQQTGLLFAEVCVKQAKKGSGRIGIILPNGYLGNRSHRYTIFREWLLRETKLVGICSFPRFTFKSSGADVSASVLFLERRRKPLKTHVVEDYEFFVEQIEKLGWDAGTKKAAPAYVQNSDDGSLIIEEDGNPIIDSDFGEAISRIRSGVAAQHFDWLSEGQQVDENDHSWSIPISTVMSDPYRTLDPKRYCRKVMLLQEELSRREHFLLGDVLDFIPERTTSRGESVRAAASTEYSYTEISDIGYGDFHSKKLRGWELPDRARHIAEEGDIYFGSIWGSVSKWFYVGSGYPNLVVTNGCHRCRVKSGSEELLLDLIAYMNTEGWSIQLRSLARGSDGLAEVTVDDVKQVIIPRILDASVRSKVAPYIKNLKSGRVTIRSAVLGLIDDDKWDLDEPNKRPSHIVLV